MSHLAVPAIAIRLPSPAPPRKTALLQGPGCKWHFIYALVRDLAEVARGPSVLPPCECHCQASPVDCEAGGCAALERLLEKQLSLGRPVTSGLAVPVPVLCGIGLALFLLGLCLGAACTHRAGRAQPAPSTLPEGPFGRRTLRTGKGIVLEAPSA